MEEGKPINIKAKLIFELISFLGHKPQLSPLHLMNYAESRDPSPCRSLRRKEIEEENFSCFAFLASPKIEPRAEFMEEHSINVFLNHFDSFSPFSCITSSPRRVRLLAPLTALSTSTDEAHPSCFNYGKQLWSLSLSQPPSHVLQLVWKLTQLAYSENVFGVVNISSLCCSFYDFNESFSLCDVDDKSRSEIWHKYLLNVQ